MQPRLVVAMLAAVLPVFGQTLNGPEPLVFFDGLSKSFRGILGVPGYASVAPPTQEIFDIGSVAPGGRHALAIREGNVFLVLDPVNASKATKISDGLEFGSDASWSWSADGQTAVLLSKQGNWVQLVSGLPGEAKLGRRVSGAELGGSITAAAVSRKGLRAVVTVSESAGIFSLGVDGDRVTRIADDSAQLIVPSSSKDDEFMIWNSESRSFGILHAGDSAAARVESWTVSSEIEAPLLTMATARFGQSEILAVVTGEAPGKVTVFDLTSHEVLAELPLPVSVSALSVLGSESLLLDGTRQAGNPLWVLKWSPEFRVHFVPDSSMAAIAGSQGQ